MKTISLRKLTEDPAAHAEVQRVLAAGGLVCLPAGASYRIVADLTSEQAVSRLLQSKRRTGNAPALVFVGSEGMLRQVAAEVCPVRQRLMKAFWPGPLTILFTPNPQLPERVVKPLVRANGKLGVRIPDDPVVVEVLRRFGRPLLVSSANPEKKKGASSPAQVRKNFLGRVEVFIDAGDLPPAVASTVVDIRDGAVAVTRAGAIETAAVMAAALPR